MNFFWLIIHFSVLLAVKLAIPFSLYIMYIILIFPFHIYTFFSSFLSWEPLNFRWGPQNLGTQKHTCCQTINTFFIVNHVHYFNMFFSHIIYTFFSSFLSWEPLNFRWGPQNLGTQKHTCCQTTNLNSSFVIS